MVSAKDWRVPGQVIEVVHDDSHEQVEHKEGAKEDERDEVGVGHVGAASLQRVTNTFYIHNSIVTTNGVFKGGDSFWPKIWNLSSLSPFQNGVQE